jgi:hypothetical protein
MSNGTNIPADRSISMEFMRLLFTNPIEEKVAYRWAARFADVTGHHALNLRPSTTFAEMMKWAEAAAVDTMDFLFVFEPELRMDLADFLDSAESITFRHMVQHYAGKFTSMSELRRALSG